MNQKKFISDLKDVIKFHYQQIKEDNPLISFGLYTDGDASTLGIYYNTKKHLEQQLKHLKDPTKKGYYTFFMEEWKADISEHLMDKKLDELNERICSFGSDENERGNEDCHYLIFDLFIEALHSLKLEGFFKQESKDFFLHLEVSDFFIDSEMLERVSKIHSEHRHNEYKEYATIINSY